jgi:hypothetical protein
MTSVSQLCQTFQTVLTTVADHAAHATRFVQRQSKLTGAKFAQTIRQHVIWLASALESEAHMTKVFRTIQACLAKGARLNPRKTKPNLYQLLLACGKEVLA